MTGADYANLIAAYLAHNFAARGIEVYREVNVGKSIIGKNRRIDILVVDTANVRALAIECKYQGTSGTTDEKVPYAIQDLEAMRMPSCVLYAGEGWSTGVKHMLEASPLAAFCLPEMKTLKRTSETRELDHMLAQAFRWWDMLLVGKKPFGVDEWRAKQSLP